MFIFMAREISSYRIAGSLRSLIPRNILRRNGKPNPARAVSSRSTGASRADTCDVSSGVDSDSNLGIVGSIGIIGTIGSPICIPKDTL